MLYNPPTGGAANDPYVGKNVAAGIQGSKVPPGAVEFPQRELMAIIAADSNLSPSNTDLGQAQKSIAYQIAQAVAGVPAVIHDTAADTSTSAATILATATPAVTTRQAGYGYIVFPANTCAGATQINVGFGLVALTRSDASALVAGDYAKGQPLVIIDDGTKMRLATMAPSQAPTPQTIASGEGVAIADNMANLAFAGLTEEDTINAADLVAFYASEAEGGQAAGHHYKTTFAKLAAAIFSSQIGATSTQAFVGWKMISASGNFVPDAGCTIVDVIGLWGPGGSGGTDTGSGAGGGGGGGFTAGSYPVTAGQAYPCVIPAGGSGQTASFGSFCSATAGGNGNGTAPGSGGQGYGQVSFPGTSGLAPNTISNLYFPGPAGSAFQSAGPTTSGPVYNGVLPGAGGTGGNSRISTPASGVGGPALLILRQRSGG